MHQELALKAITHGIIGIVIITLLLVLLIGLRKELDVDTPLRGTVHLGITVLGLCAFLALMAALYSARKVVVPETISSRLDTAEFDAKFRHCG
ncbi:MAG: hypothetical protein ACREQV_21665 [Candidatus Binatia bacterium]